MKYCSFSFEMGSHDHEIWQALLGDWPFESFQDEENTVTGYIKEDLISPGLKEYLASAENIFFESYSIASVPEKNWNEVWENSFPPIAVDDFCYIRASFHPFPTEKYKHVLTIAPRMAFGTGHHATTYMMIRAMAKMNFVNLNVLDFGCGTGILSMVAAKEGAKHIHGVDIQKEAVENSIEHSVLNNVESQCLFHQGELEKVSGSFDIVLANIDRNTILANLESINNLTKPGSYLLVSGILVKDQAIVENAFQETHFRIIEKSEKDDWLQFTLQKT